MPEDTVAEPRISADRRRELLGFRHDFSVIEKIDPEEKQRLVADRIKVITESIKNFSGNEEYQGMPPFNLDNDNNKLLIRTIANTWVETSKVLSFRREPSFGIFKEEAATDLSDPEEEWLTSAQHVSDIDNPRAAGRVEINIIYLQSLSKKANSSPRELVTAVREVRQVVAQEMCHDYVSRYYSRAHNKSVQANLDLMTGAQEAYENDRDERFSKMFGEKYAEYIASRRGK